MCFCSLSILPFFCMLQFSYNTISIRDYFKFKEDIKYENQSLDLKKEELEDLKALVKNDYEAMNELSELSMTPNFENDFTFGIFRTIIKEFKIENKEVEAKTELENIMENTFIPIEV